MKAPQLDLTGDEIRDLEETLNRLNREAEELFA